jgi:hypothetical protein
MFIEGNNLIDQSMKNISIENYKLNIYILYTTGAKGEKWSFPRLELLPFD